MNRREESPGVKSTSETVATKETETVATKEGASTSTGRNSVATTEEGG